MADHLQQQILDYVKTTLIAASIVGSGHVFLDRVDELQQSDLSALHIEGGDEDVIADTVGFPTINTRAYTFTVACVCGLAADAAKTARNLGASVEAALLASMTTFTANGKAQALYLSSSTETKDGAGAVPFFEVRQTWQAQYVTLGGTPDTPA
jgi:hypothetical protein